MPPPQKSMNKGGAKTDQIQYKKDFPYKRVSVNYYTITCRSNTPTTPVRFQIRVYEV
jgi:hypothetical protein